MLEGIGHLLISGQLARFSRINFESSFLLHVKYHRVLFIVIHFVFPVPFGSISEVIYVFYLSLNFSPSFSRFFKYYFLGVGGPSEPEGREERPGGRRHPPAQVLDYCTTVSCSCL
jgi:hypothetical protein